ncbi:MAG: AI-2E family transporter [Chlorobi bacterium]|nr:AI-2E family transporter [Chlorobiota bacterium]
MENKLEHYLQFVPGIRFWIIATGVIVVFAALKAASHLVNIVLVAAFLTAVSMAPLNWLKKHGVNKTLANIIVILTAVLVIGIIGLVIGASINSFAEKMPVYEDKFVTIWDNTVKSLYEKGFLENQMTIKEGFKSGNLIMIAAAPVASGFGTVISGGFIIFILFVFMMFESDMFMRKLHYISRGSSKDADMIVHQLRSYFGIKTLTSLTTGVLIGLMLFILGVDFPVLWGFFAFILNYIPSIGSFIAAIPAVLIAFIIQGPFMGAVTLVGYLVINTIIGNVIEPQLMGKNLGLSPFVVFFSMIFFGFILGPIGMLIATPLTIILKMIFDNRPVTRNIGIMLGDGREIRSGGINKRDF